MTDSFFETGSDVVIPQRDALGVSGVINKLIEDPRMETIMLISSAKTLLDTYGKPSQISFDENTRRVLDKDTADLGNFEPGAIRTEAVETTESSAPYVLGGISFNLRPIRFSYESGLGQDIFFVLDETENYKQINVRNPFLIKLEVGDKQDEIPKLEIRGMDGLSVDEPVAVKALLDRIGVINKSEERLANQLVRERENEQARDLRDREFRERQAEEERQRVIDAQKSRASRFFSYIGDRSETFITTGIVGVVVGGIAVGGYFAIKAIVKEANDFDCETECNIGVYDSGAPRLSDGRILSIGESSSPMTTFEVTQIETFSRSVVPEIGSKDSADNGDFGPNAKGSGDLEDLANIDFAREIVLTSSNADTDTDGDDVADASCDRAFVDLANSEDQIIVAMPSVYQDRIEEFTIDFENDASILFCWKGVEKNAQDDPYVVLHRVGEPIIPASERDIRPETATEEPS